MSGSGANLAAAQWPEMTIPPGTKSIVERFYQLVDTETEEAFRQFAELFVPDGNIEIGEKKIRGREALETERRHSWEKIERRAHNIYRVYTTKKSGTDLLVIGRVDIGTRNGHDFSQEFAQNFILQGNEGGYLIRKFQAWIDSAPLANAIAGK